MIIGFKTKIYPNNIVKQQLEGLFGYSRYIYNKGLEYWKKEYELYKEDSNKYIFPNSRYIRDLLKASKEDWEKEYTPNVLDTAIEDLGKAFKNFFSKRNSYPKFKKRNFLIETVRFYRKNDSTIRIIDNKLNIVKMKDTIRMAEELPKGIIKECTITKRCNNYYASFAIEIDEDDLKYSIPKDDSSVGIDLNIGHYDISEENHKYILPIKQLKPLYIKLKHYQKMLSRKIYNSINYIKVRTKLNKVYETITNIKRDWLHKFTTMIVTNYQNICIENLNIKGMIKNKRLSRVISESTFYMCKEFLSYKSKWYGNNLVIANRFYPSTQMCSKCGYIKAKKNKMTLKDRQYICPICKNNIDRDYNSAINLKNYITLLNTL